MIGEAHTQVLIWLVDKERGTRRGIESIPLAVLSAHNGWALSLPPRCAHGDTALSWVKDMTWDPVGRYLATASDDKVRAPEGPRANRTA